MPTTIVCSLTPGASVISSALIDRYRLEHSIEIGQVRREIFRFSLVELVACILSIVFEVLYKRVTIFNQSGDFIRVAWQ